MAIGIMGRKIGMARVFGPGGKSIPVTVIEAGPCPVTQIKNQETDGYTAVQLAFDELKENRANKPAKGHFAKAGKGAYRNLREFRVDNIDEFELGGEVKADIFTPGEQVKVTGTTIGKGFQGVMKRWNFRGMPASHGHEKVHRSPGSIGHATFPGKVFKGKKMAGRMGGKKETIRNIKIYDVRPDENIIIVRGAVPGPRNGLVMITKQ